MLVQEAMVDRGLYLLVIAAIMAAGFAYVVIGRIAVSPASSTPPSVSDTAKVPAGHPG